MATIFEIGQRVELKTEYINDSIVYIVNSVDSIFIECLCVSSENGILKMLKINKDLLKPYNDRKISEFN